MTGKYEDQTFYREDVELDDMTFVRCTFHQCDLIFRGGVVPTMQGCTWDNSKLAFKDAAERTLQFMAAMHHGGYAAIIEQTFEGIKRGDYISKS